MAPGSPKSLLFHLPEAGCQGIPDEPDSVDNDKAALAKHDALYKPRVLLTAQCTAAQASDPPVLSVDVSSVPLELSSGAGAVDPEAGPSLGQQRRQCLV